MAETDVKFGNPLKEPARRHAMERQEMILQSPLRPKHIQNLYEALTITTECAGHQYLLPTHSEI